MASEWEVVEDTDATPQPDQPDQGEGGGTSDDWSVADTSPMEATQQAPQEGDWEVESHEPWTPAQSFAAGAAKGAVPATGGLAAGLLAGGAATPFVSPVGGVLVGLGVGMGAGWLLDYGQDKLLAAMGFDKPLKEAAEQNPLSFTAGNMAPGAALLKPSGSMLQRGIGAAIGAAVEGGQQAVNGEFDAGKLAMGAGFGAAFPGANAAGNKVIATGEQIGERLSNKLYRGEGGRYRGGNKNPDLKEIPADEAAPERTAEAPQEDEITLANDEPQVAAGVAVEQQAPPEIIGAGNPEGAPGAQRVAAKPSAPERNYQKDQPQNQPATTESKVVDTEPMKSDIQAALSQEGEPVPRSEGTDVLPTDAVPTNEAPSAVPHSEPVHEAPPLSPAEEAANLAAQRTQVKNAASLAPSVDPLEASQMQRRSAQQIKDRVAEGQRGEAFKPEKPEPLTGAELKSLAEDRAMLAKAGFDRALAALDSVTPRRQVELARQAANTIRQERATETGAKKSEGEARRPDGELRKESRAKLETGVLAASKKDAARKTEAIKNVRSIYDEFGPKSENGKKVDPLAGDVKATKAYTKQVWAEAVKRNGGRDPLARSKEQYVPLEKGDHTDAYQWLKAVKASAKGQNHKSFATLHTTEGMGALDAETGRVEGDIAHRPQIEEAGGEAETATGAMERDRISFEHLNPDPRPGSDNSYVEDHNTLADWINDRSPREYEKLSEHYDLGAEMDEPADPRELLSAMKQVLADTGRRPKGEITTEVELPPKPVKAPVLPQKEEPAASQGRVLDKNSDEFKRLAAAYAEKAPKGPVKPKAEQLADLSAKERSAAEAINGSTHEGLIDKVKKFVGDESGAGFLHQMFSQPANPSSPAALPGVKDYADTLSLKFRDRSADTKNTKLEIMANLAKAADVGLTPHEHRQIALAEQDNKIGALPQKLRDFYSDHVSPVRDRAMQVMRDFKDLNDSERLGYELPNLNAVTTKAYQPRYQIDKQSFNKADTDAFDPFTGQGLGDWSPNLEDRKFMAIENGGQRMVVEVTGDKDTGFGLSIHRGGPVTKLQNLPASFEGKLGDEIPLNVKGKKGKWTVDQATTKEIEKATGLKYYENAAWAWSRMLDDMTRAYENAKLTTEIKNDPMFQKLTTTDRDVAKANGWSSKVTTHLPDFATQNGKPVYMPDAMRWVFDDYHKPGFGGLTSEGIEKLRNFNVALLKVFNTNAPLVHVLNELDLFTVGRGFKWLSPKSYYDLAVSAPTAFKSVNSQDKLQAEMRKAGVNPMLASVSMRTMYETAAKNMGMEIIKDHSKWDPIARAYGVSTKEVGQKLYDLSSDVTWRLSDYLTTMRYLEEKRAGYGPEEAAKRVNKFMSDYHVGTTVMGSRALQQLLTEPSVTAFGRYKAGIFRSLAGMTRDLLSPKATKQERIDALGQWLVMGALGYVVYPAADALVRKVTGNEGGELRRRGVSSVAEAVANVATGEKDPVALATRAWTPAPALNAGMELVKNKDFTGKPIFPQGEWPGVIPDAAANVAEYGARTVVPPYGTLSQHAMRPESTAGDVAGALVADQLGVGLPSEASQKRAGRIEKINAQAEKARHKRPGGVIPSLMNRVTD